MNLGTYCAKLAGSEHIELAGKVERLKSNLIAGITDLWGGIARTFALGVAAGHIPGETPPYPGIW